MTTQREQAVAALFDATGTHAYDGLLDALDANPAAKAALAAWLHEDADVLVAEYDATGRHADHLAEVWTDVPGHGDKQFKVGSGPMGTEREDACCYSIHEFEAVCPRTGHTFR